jgi:hypothetical protein
MRITIINFFIWIAVILTFATVSNGQTNVKFDNAYPYHSKKIQFHSSLYDSAGNKINTSATGNLNKSDSGTVAGKYVSPYYFNTHVKNAVVSDSTADSTKKVPSTVLLKSDSGTTAGKYPSPYYVQTHSGGVGDMSKSDSGTSAGQYISPYYLFTHSGSGGLSPADSGTTAGKYISPYYFNTHATQGGLLPSDSGTTASKYVSPYYFNTHATLGGLLPSDSGAVAGKYLSPYYFNTHATQGGLLLSDSGTTAGKYVSPYYFNSTVPTLIHDSLKTMLLQGDSTVSITIKIGLHQDTVIFHNIISQIKFDSIEIQSSDIGSIGVNGSTDIGIPSSFKAKINSIISVTAPQIYYAHGLTSVSAFYSNSSTILLRLYFANGYSSEQDDDIFRISYLVQQ